jgi:glucokinase
MKECVIGIDIGATNIAFGLVTEVGDILIEESFPTRNFNDASEFVDFMVNYMCDKTHLYSIKGIGIGAPNGNYYTGEILNAPNLHWRGIIPLAEMFKKEFNVPTMLTNDANAAAYGEMIFGIAQNYKHFTTVTLGTGLGSGIVMNREIIYGAHGIAGEYGHIRVVHDGRKCKCGRLGCLETYVSATGVVRSIQELPSENKASSKLMAIKKPKAQDIFKLAEEGDLFAIEIIEFTAETLGSALADYAAFSDPEAYVLFGGIAQSGEGFAQKVKYYMEKNILDIYQNRIEIKISSLHHRNAAVLGTAASIYLDLKKDPS